MDHNLPPAHDQFFGRHNAQQEIHTRLDQPWCRLVTITGLGGAGKTRLATTIARSRLSQYRDGVWLIELSELDPDDDNLAEAIAVEIATALDLRLTGLTTPVEQLLTHLQHKQMLLVLDNFEHLLDGVQIVRDIVTRCVQIQLVITSRETLQLQAEWTIALTGLSYPLSAEDETASDAVDLFTARRAQQRRDEISANELVAIRQICRMVAGLPLAIELAAALARHTSAHDVASSLHAGFDALTTSLRDVPARHRGLHVVFQMSWRTLTPTLQQQLAQLSIFRGGFTKTAARQITAADLTHLGALIDKSLLAYHAETERYTLHPVIRAYAAEKRDPADPTPQKHARYYLALLAQYTKPLQKDQPQVAIRLLEPDLDNVHRAWETGLATRCAGLLYDALTSLSIYYQMRGLAREGEAIMHTTYDTAVSWGEEGQPLATRAGLERARFQNRLGHSQAAIQTIQAALQLAARCADRWAEAMGRVWWAEALWRLGKHQLAREKLNHALEIAGDLNASFIIGWCHHQLGIVNDIQGHYDAALVHLQQACAVWRRLDNARTLSASLNSVGLVYYHHWDLPAAQETLDQTLRLCKQIDYRHLEAILLNNLSIIATEQGDYNGAQYYLQHGLRLSILNGNLSGQGDIYTNLGRIDRLLGNLDASLENLERGKQIAQSTDNRALLAVVMLNLAKTRQAQNNYSLAKSLCRQALIIARKSNLRDTECEILLSMAQLVSERSEKKARRYSTQAVELAEALQNPKILERARAINTYLYASVDTDD